MHAQIAGRTLHLTPSALLRQSICAAFLITANAPSCVWAAEDVRDLSLNKFVDATSLESLAGFIVTDSKTPQAPNSVTQRVEVISESVFNNRPGQNRNLADILRYNSGQFVNVLARTIANWGSYGGLGPKYNSYLLDGVPMDSFADAFNIDPAAIERVEVYHGPAAVMYSNYLTMDFAGNETPLTGTTNFILRKQVDETYSNFMLGAGTWNTVQARGYHQGHSGNLSYYMGLMQETSDYTGKYNNPDANTGLTNSPNYRRRLYFANLNYSFDRPDHTLSVFVHQNTLDGDAGRINNPFHHRYNTVNLAYENQFSDAWRILFKLGDRDYKRGFANDQYPTSYAFDRLETTRQHIVPADLSLNYTHGDNSVLTVGMDYQSVDYSVDNMAASGTLTRTNQARAESHGVYAQEKLHLGNWIVRGGVRQNRLTHTYDILGGNIPTVSGKAWDITLWSAGVRYNFSDAFSVYANSGNSFTAPAAKQIGGTVTGALASGELANPALTPEKGLGNDLGMEWKASPKLSISSRLFFNTISNAIVTSVVSVAPSQTRSINAGRLDARGIELEVKYTPSKAFNAFANLTRTRSVLSTPTDPKTDGSATPFSPALMMNAGVQYKADDQLTISPYVQWVGRYYDSADRTSRQEFGGYALFNLRVSYQVESNLLLFADMVNLANRRVRKPFDLTDTGFEAFTGLQYSF